MYGTEDTVCPASTCGRTSFLIIFFCYTGKKNGGYIYGSAALVDLGRFFNFLIHIQLVALFGRGTRHTDIHTSSEIRTHDPSV
jgi:hypothetical protein